MSVFGRVSSNPLFYALKISGSEYAVVPALWGRWSGMQVHLMGMREIFGIENIMDTVYISTRVISPAIVALQGNKWMLKRLVRSSLAKCKRKSYTAAVMGHGLHKTRKKYPRKITAVYQENPKIF